MSPRPGRVAGIVDVDLPYPRTGDTREEPRFFELATEVRELLRGYRTPTAASRTRSHEARRGPRRRVVPGAGRPRARARRLGGRRSTSSTIQTFLLPKPSEIAPGVLGPARRALAGRAGTRSREAFWGFVIGVSAGIARRARARALPARSASALMPYFVAASAIPIIAFAPIANAWFGIEKSSKIFIAAVLCFFPVLVNTLRGPHVGEAAAGRADALLRRRRLSPSSGASGSRPRCRTCSRRSRSRACSR